MTEIKAIRKKLKMSQQGFADKIGVHRVTVSRWESQSKRLSNLAKRQLSRLVRG